MVGNGGDGGIVIGWIDDVCWVREVGCGGWDWTCFWGKYGGESACVCGIVVMVMGRF